MSDLWYIARDGQQAGPYSTRDIKHMASVGDLRRTDQLWKEGMAASVLASKVKGLFPAASGSESAATRRTDNRKSGNQITVSQTGASNQPHALPSETVNDNSQQQPANDSDNPFAVLEDDAADSKSAQSFEKVRQKSGFQKLNKRTISISIVIIVSVLITTGISLWMLLPRSQRANLIGVWRQDSETWSTNATDQMEWVPTNKAETEEPARQAIQFIPNGMLIVHKRDREFRDKYDFDSTTDPPTLRMPALHTAEESDGEYQVAFLPNGVLKLSAAGTLLKIDSDGKRTLSPTTVIITFTRLQSVPRKISEEEAQKLEELEQRRRKIVEMLPTMTKAVEKIGRKESNSDLAKRVRAVHEKALADLRLIDAEIKKLNPF